MIAYWVNFARNGDPNGAGLPKWPTYQGADSQLMRFGISSSATPENGTARFQFIRSFRKDGRFPDSWRQAKGRMPAAIANVIAKAIILLVRAKSLMSSRTKRKVHA